MEEKNTESKNIFEKKLEQLENLVTQLQEESLPLDKSLQVFEKAVNLSRECDTHLSKTEQKIKMLMPLENSEGDR